MSPAPKLKHLATQPPAAGLNESATDGEPDWPRYIRTTDIESPFTLGEDVARVEPGKVGGLDVRAGDLLICRTGSLGTVYMHASATRAAFAGYLVRVRPDRRKAHPKYLGYWARSTHCQEQIHAGAIRSTVDNFSASRVGALRVPPVHVTYQPAIADFLDSECERIAALTLELEGLHTIRRESYEKLLADEVGLARWTKVQIRHVARTGTGHTPSREHPEYWVPSECTLPWFTLADVWQIRDDQRLTVADTAEAISPAGIAHSSAKLHPRGTVLLSRTASVGFSAVMDRAMAVSQDFMTWTCGPKLDPYFLLFSLRAMRPELRRLMTGSTHQTIYMPDLHALRIPLPDITEQERAVHALRASLDRHWTARSELEAVTGLLAEYRDALITEAVTGKLDVSRLSEQQMEESAHAAMDGEAPEVLSA